MTSASLTPRSCQARKSLQLHYKAKKIIVKSIYVPQVGQTRKSQQTHTHTHTHTQRSSLCHVAGAKGLHPEFQNGDESGWEKLAYPTMIRIYLCRLVSIYTAYTHLHSLVCMCVCARIDTYTRTHMRSIHTHNTHTNSSDQALSRFSVFMRLGSNVGINIYLHACSIYSLTLSLTHSLPPSLPPSLPLSMYVCMYVFIPVQSGSVSGTHVSSKATVQQVLSLLSFLVQKYKY